MFPRQDLKSEALRPRHWERLMELTGKSFDMDPKSFTLGALFAMHLHNFAQVTTLHNQGGADQQRTLSPALVEGT
jgi:hypothetical protein